MTDVAPSFLIVCHHACKGCLGTALHRTVWALTSVPYSERMHLQESPRKEEVDEEEGNYRNFRNSHRIYLWNDEDIGVIDLCIGFFLFLFPNSYQGG